jgi:copper transport protein
MNRLCKLLLFVVAATAVIIFVGGPVGAHTGFESSSPADGSVLDSPVEEITLVFSGEAEPAGEGFEVLDVDGQLRKPETASTVDGLTYVLGFDPPLAGGTVGVRWKVKAADAHAIEGTFVFEVAAPPAPPGIATVAPGKPPQQDQAGENDAALRDFTASLGEASNSPQRIAAVSRIAGIVGALVGIGALVFAATALRGSDEDIHTVLRWAQRAGALVVFSAIGELIGQLALEAGEWSQLWYPSNIFSVLWAPFGLSVLFRFGGGLALTAGGETYVIEARHAPDAVLALKQFVPVGAGVGGQRRGEDLSWTDESDFRDRPSGPYVHHDDTAWAPTAESGAAFVGALTILASFLFDGHTVTEGIPWVTAVLDVVHVAAGAVWAGGVAMLVVVLWGRHRAGRDVRALQLAVRFSVIAAIALVAVAIAGVGLTVIILDSPSQLWSTAWGRLLMAKTAVVGVAAMMGGYNHKVLIPQMAVEPEDQRVASEFRRVVTIEAALLGGVALVTAFLVAAST